MANYSLEILENSFQPITLKEMDSVKLMNRTDSKYVFEVARLNEILDALKDQYRVLEVSGTRVSRYETLYYDTENFELFFRHLAGKSNRHKIRSRNYVESDLNFLEAKFKNNKKRTLKNRIKIDEISKELHLDEKQSDFLINETGYEAEKLLPKFWVNYHRITLVSLERNERCTIDLGMEFVNDDQVSDFSFLVILELKQDSATASPISELMKKLHIRSGGLSKYCLGVVSLNPTIKHNNFKPKLMLINKLRPNEKN